MGLLLLIGFHRRRFQPERFYELVEGGKLSSRIEMMADTGCPGSGGTRYTRLPLLCARSFSEDT